MRALRRDRPMSCTPRCKNFSFRKHCESCTMAAAIHLGMGFNTDSYRFAHQFIRGSLLDPCGWRSLRWRTDCCPTRSHKIPFLCWKVVGLLVSWKEGSVTRGGPLQFAQSDLWATQRSPTLDCLRVRGPPPPRSASECLKKVQHFVGRKLWARRGTQNSCRASLWTKTDVWPLLPVRSYRTVSERNISRQYMIAPLIQRGQKGMHLSNAVQYTEIANYRELIPHSASSRDRMTQRKIRIDSESDQNDGKPFPLRRP